MNIKAYVEHLKSELPTVRVLIAMCVAELIGTAFLILFTCMGNIDKKSEIIPLQHSFAYGMAVMTITTSFRHVSRSHLNPTVTICAAIYDSFPILLVPVYILLQIIGSIIGYAMLMVILPKSMYEDGFCVTYLHPTLHWFQGFLIEFLTSGILIAVYCGLWDPRNYTRMDSLPLKIGFTVTGLALISGPYTGGSMNPVRSFAPAVFQKMWKNHFVYWFAPCISGALTTIVYLVYFSKPK